MSETSSAPPPAPTTQGDFAARLASRLCHDFISPASAIVTGLDLLEDPQAGKEMEAEAMSLIASSSRKLVALLTFARTAFGGSSAAETFETEMLKGLAVAHFEHVRAELDWQVAPQTVSRAAARSLLLLSDMGSGALPMGGTARVTGKAEGGFFALKCECKGPRLRLDDQVRAGLAGEPAPPGPAGKWTGAYYVWLQLKEAGGAVAVEQSDDSIVFTAGAPL